MGYLNQKNSNRLISSYGPWALVTGATSGIGKELTIHLARAGFKIVMTARSVNDLNELKTSLFDQFKTECLTVPGDLSNKESVDALLEETSQLPIGLVILNAGFGTSGKLLEADINTELNLIDLNCKSVLKMSHHFANHMKSQSRKGAIVLLSSMVAFQGVPLAANYAASKAYVQSFGEALARELKNENIDVLCAAPGPVKTRFADRARMQMGMALTADKIAAPILSSIGRKTTVFPGLLTKFLVYNLRMVPRWAKVRIMESVMGGFTKHQNL